MQLNEKELDFVKGLVGSTFLGLIGYDEKNIKVKVGERNSFNELINIKIIKVKRPEIVV